MLRRLGGCAVALALLLPAQAHAAPSTPTSTSERAGAAVTKSRTVDLGHKPVRASSRDRVRLTFDGRKGQLVHLARWADTETCGRRVLKKANGATVKQWAPGYWRLPRTGTFTAIGKPCRAEKQRVRLQVRRVVREDRLLEGDTTTVGTNSRVTHLVPFRLVGGQRAYIDGRGVQALIRPDRTVTHVSPGETVVPVEGGAASPVGMDVPSPPGRYFVEVAPGARFELRVSVVRTVGVDGAPVVVPAGQSARLSFSGTAGQWVHAEITSATTGEAAYRNRMYNVIQGVDYFLPAVQVDCPGGGRGSCQVIQLPADGTYAVSVPISEGDDLDVSVRVRSALRAAPATVDGPAVAYTSASPGQWVVGDLPELPRDESGGSGVTMAISNASASLGDWRVRAVSGYGPCRPGLLNECFNIYGPPNAFTLSPTSTTAPLPWDTFANQAVAVLAVLPGTTGSLDLSLTSSRTQP